MNTELKTNRRRTTLYLNELVELKACLSDETLIKLKEQFMLERQLIDACLVARAQQDIDDQEWRKRALTACHAKRVSIQLCEKELNRRHSPEAQSKPKSEAKTKVNSNQIQPVKVPSVDKYFMRQAEAMLSPEQFAVIYRQAYAEYLQAFRQQASLALAAHREAVAQQWF
jgi:hypothetical protein